MCMCSQVGFAWSHGFVLSLGEQYLLIRSLMYSHTAHSISAYFSLVSSRGLHMLLRVIMSMVH